VRRSVASSGPVAVLGPLALLSLFLLAGSIPATAAAGLPSADPHARSLLQRAAMAPDEVTYQGTQFVSAWTEQGSTGLVVDVVHRAGRGTTVRTAGTATAPAGSSYVPADATAPSLLAGVTTLNLLAQHFDLATGPAGKVAGRPVDVVVATGPGRGTPAARFWLDRDTGLVLRREVYDEAGRTTRASAFVDVTISEAGDDLGVEGGDETRHSDASYAWPRPIHSAALAKMRRHGWACPDRLPPSLQLVDARRGGGSYGGIVHLSYSDGLASVSVFQQRGRLQADKLDGYRATTVNGAVIYVRDGVPQRLTWAADGTVYSVVADASALTVGSVVAALPHARDDGGAWNRVERGLNRMASWFNPFG
jgi:sigma-E factor negative regulatory protein RseB